MSDSGIKFWKYQASGNDYIVIPGDDKFFKPSTERIQQICNRNLGIGSDGILWGPFENEDFQLRIFNPDGSEAEKSGNGIRIFSRHLLDQGYWKHGENELLTKGGRVKVFSREGEDEISVEMGEVSMQPKDIPINDSEPWLDRELKIQDKKFQVFCLSIGNPHCVVLCDELPSREEVLANGPLIENYPTFSNRINVQFMKVLDLTSIQIEIWERGAGYTLSSGTSASASAFAAHYLGFCEKDLQVKMPGGQFSISINGKEITLTGPVTPIGEGIIF